MLWSFLKGWSQTQMSKFKLKETSKKNSRWVHVRSVANEVRQWPSEKQVSRVISVPSQTKKAEDSKK